MSEASGMSRRDFLKLGGAFVLTSIPGVDAIGASLEREPNVAAEILLFHTEMKKGGRYREAISGSHINRPVVEEMVKSMERISTELRSTHHGNGTSDTEVGKYIISHQLPGLVTMRIDTGREHIEDGKRHKIISHCNGFFLHGGGKTRLVTADHCFSEQSPTRKEFESFNTAGIDMARRDVSTEYKGAALKFDGHTTRDDVSGALGVTVGEKNGIADAFYSPLVPMTDAIYTEMLVKSGMSVTHDMERHIREGMWKILPPSQGEQRDGSVAAKGRSGSIEVAYEPRRRGYTPAGLFFAVCMPSSGVFRGRVIGFVSSPNALEAIVSSGVGKFARPVLKP